jgi:hypothetical protein
MLVSGDSHDIFSSESIGLTDSSLGSRSGFQIGAGFCICEYYIIIKCNFG